jgi:diguanylate cyclase (GGDEF)-like protein
MTRDAKVYIALIGTWGAALAAVCLHLGVEAEAPWAAPVILLFFFLAYQFDVKVPGLGSLNVDQAIAFPAVVLLQSPALAGLLAGVGMASSRIYRRGFRRFSALNGFDSLQTAVSVMVGGWFYLEATRGLTDGSVVWYLDLLLAMILSSAMGFCAVFLAKYLTRQRVPWSAVRATIPLTGLWIAVSSPFVALVVGAILEEQPLKVFLASLPLLTVVWTLKLNARLEEQNDALVAVSRKQEFLQSLNAKPSNLLEDPESLRGLLADLKGFVPWDRELLLILPLSRHSEPLAIRLGDVPEDAEAVQAKLTDILGEAALEAPRTSHGDGVKPLLLKGARSQVVAAIATPEVAFGILAAERAPGRPAFSADEVLFLRLALSEVAHLTQEEVLKSHLMLTNQKLVQQMNYLRQIFQISDLLRVHLDMQGLLERVAKGIRENLGFQSVLISLYHEDEGYFERVAQAGDDERWEEIRAQRPPAEKILMYFQEKFRAGASYFVSHNENLPSPYAVLPRHPKVPAQPDDWDPMDLLLVPLMDKDDRLIGVISVDEPLDGKIPSDETLRALEILANQTVHSLESAEVHAQIKRQATTDGLTGLYNHAHFQKTLAACAKEMSEANLAYTVLMMDLDNFKDINDHYGHLAGDAVLRAVAGAISSTTRKEDVAARYGGEEFAILLPRMGLQQSKPVAERIRKAVEDVRVLAEGVGGSIKVTLSVGVASYPENGSDHHQVLEQADAALYRAKREGKNRVCRIG